VKALRAALDARVLGHADVKIGLVLALLAREHVLLEGPVGCAKSALARALARCGGARCFELALHRDLRPADWQGDTILCRTETARGERLQLRSAPGPLLEAEVWLLDGLSRAPSAAITALMRILERRRTAQSVLPLECVIATAGLPEQELHSDELEPALRDRFGVQLRMRGLLAGGHWAEARALLESPPPAAGVQPVLDTRRRQRLQQRVARTRLPASVREAWLGLLAELRRDLEPEDAARLGDRTLARTGPALLRAHAVFRGESEVGRADLPALRYALAGRLPESVAAELAARLADAAGLPMPVGAGVGEVAGAGGAASARRPPAPGSACAVGLGSSSGSATRGADVTSLIRALEGRILRGAAGEREDPAGAPRRRGRLRSLDEILDADAVDALRLAEGTELQPSVLRRARGGRAAVALLRDVSASMQGGLSRWAGELVTGLVRSAQAHGLRVGYVEFNHDAHCFRARRAFFHRRYPELLARCAERHASGRTNYEAPLRLALRAFQHAPARSRHIVLLTDGVPVVGDPEVRDERALARRLGVRVHTIFVGLGPPPPVLGRLARETDGLAFAGRPGPGGQLTLEAR
jgi:MoxR-like ATPase